MDTQDVSRTELDYHRVAWRVAAAKRRAEAKVIDRHRCDFGTCGFAVIVIEDATASKVFRRHYPSLHGENGFLEFGAACRDWQSATAAEEVAAAMVEELKACGIPASFYTRIDG